MVKEKKTQSDVSAPEAAAVENTSKKTTLKKSTAITVSLLLGAVIVWGVLAYKVSQNDKDSFLGSYFSSDKDDPVVATIDGKNVYLSQIKNVADQIPQLAELPFDMIYPQLLQRYLTKEVIYKSAQESDVQKDPIVKEALKESHNTIISKAYLEKRMDELATPENLKALYDEEIAGMERQDEVHARHILVRTEKEANDILIQLNAGADFKMLANAKSLDAENGNGGDLGYFQKNMMIPEFGEAVFALKKGQLSKPIKTPFGWHIVYVEDRRLANLPAFEEVQEQLRQVFVERHLQEVINEESVKHQMKILMPTLRQPTAPDAVEALKQATEVSAEATEEADKELAPEAEPEATDAE